MQDSHDDYDSDEDDSLPLSAAQLKWQDLNEDFQSSTLDYSEVAEICETN